MCLGLAQEIQRMAGQPDEQWLYELRKYYCARRVWDTRDEQAPPTRDGNGRKRIETWSQWFERMFREPLTAYAERAKAEGMKAKADAWQAEQRARLR